MCLLMGCKSNYANEAMNILRSNKILNASDMLICIHVYKYICN